MKKEIMDVLKEHKVKNPGKVAGDIIKAITTIKVIPTPKKPKEGKKRVKCQVSLNGIHTYNKDGTCIFCSEYSEKDDVV